METRASSISIRKKPYDCLGFASQTDAENKEMAKELRCVVSVRIAMLFALMPPATSTIMNTTHSTTAIDNFLIDATQHQLKNRQALYCKRIQDGNTKL